MKIIKVFSCLDCPYCRLSDRACLKRDPIKARTPKEVESIPSWCPLEEEPDEMTRMTLAHGASTDVKESGYVDLDQIIKNL